MLGERERTYCKWLVRHLLNRDDTYVVSTWRRFVSELTGKWETEHYRYVPYDDRGEGKKKVLSERAIIYHVLGKCALSFYSASSDNFSKWVAWDFDNHDHRPDIVKLNACYVGHLVKVLRRHDLAPIVEESGRDGGFHVWLPFNELVPTAKLYAFGHWVIEQGFDWREILSAPPEVFPAQPSVGSGVGSSLRVPGIHPQTQRFSKIASADLSKWIEWPDAMIELAAYSGNDPAKLTHTDYKPEKDRHKKQASEDHAVATGYSVIERLFNATHTWSCVLESHGWDVHCQGYGGVTYWRRPNKFSGHSAKTDPNYRDTLYVYSDKAFPFEQDRTYSKWKAYVLLNFGGDYEAAEEHLLISK